MVHISAPRTQVHLNILERLFTRDRKEECYIGPFCFFFTLLERTSLFLFHFCLSQSIWKNANCQSGLGRFRQSVPPAESPGEQTNAVIHYSPGLGLFWVAQRFNFQWKVELGKLTICKERQRGRSLGTTYTHLDPRFSGWPTSSFLHAMMLPLSLKALLVGKFPYVKFDR